MEGMMLRSRLPLTFLAIALAATAADKPGYREVSQAIASNSADWEKLLSESVGDEALAKGTAVLFEGGNFLFALQSDKPVEIVIDDHAPEAMKKTGSRLRIHRAALQTGRTHNFSYIVDGKPFGGRTDVPAFGLYSYEKAGVPKGRLSEKIVHMSKIYPGMQSDYWIYAPAQYDPSRPAAVMVWQDGEVLVNREMPSRAQIVFDNLTHEKKIPVIVQVLISPGVTGEKKMRSIEYDTVTDTYPKFLLTEILADVSKKYNLRTDGYSRAIAGDSSGGICAFNAAWFRPGEFSRVLSRIGSFTSIQWKPGELDGGYIFPFAIRKQPKRNIRVWLQDGSGDLENNHGSWPAQNLAMANSLKLMDYDFHFSSGNGTHSRNGGHAELPEEMIWLWRDYDSNKQEQTFEQEAAEKAKPMFRIKELNR